MIDLKKINKVKITKNNFDEIVELMEQRYKNKGLSPLDIVNKTLYGFKIEAVRTTRRFVTSEPTNFVLNKELELYVKEIEVDAIKIGHLYLECIDKDDVLRRIKDIEDEKVYLFDEFDYCILYNVLGKDDLKEDSPIIDKVWCYLTETNKGIGINVL